MSSSMGYMEKIWPKRELSTFTRMVMLVGLYFLGGLLGKQGTFLSGSTVLVWPPAGIALAAILLFGYRFWPGVALGAVLFACINGTPLGFFTLGTAVGNTMGTIICTFLLRQISGFNNSMERTRDVTSYIALACFLGTTVNAAFNVVGLIYAGQASWDDLGADTISWWVPNALAALVVAPLLITWSSPSARKWNQRLILEAVVCGVGLVGGTMLSFNSWFVQGIQNYPLAYLPFPFLVWSALRFGPRGATAGTLLVSIMAVNSLLRGTGPFVTHTERDSLMLIGSYIGIIAVTNLLLAAGATERRQAELAVSESEKRFRAVVEDQTDMICRFEPDGTLVFVNESFCRFHGKPASELIGKNFFKTLSEEDAAIPLSYVNSLPKEEPVVSFDHRLRSPDKVIVWHQYRIRRLFSENGDTFEFQAVIQDITQRKQSEQALRASEEKYRSLIDNIPDVVWTANFNRDVTYIGGNVEKVLGYSAVELLADGGKLWVDRIHPEDAGSVKQAYHALFAKSENFDVEYRIQRKDGEWIWLHDRALNTRWRGGQMCADGVFLDVSHRRQYEAALQSAKDAAEAANLAKSQFLANMSHELRTPLNAIIGFSEVLTDKIFGELNPRQLKYGSNILNSGRHLLQLINDILDLAKVESGRAELLRSNFNVSKVLQDAHTVVKTLANKKGISLEFHVPPELPALYADEAKFKQILYNLLSNAVKFTPDGGQVSVTVALSTPGESLRVSVADTGIGIKPQDHARVFREFEQVDSSYGRQQQGTGLGLALTKRLVEMHGGQITVESEGIEGLGSVFIFVIPLFKPETRPGHGTTRLDARGDVLRPDILVLTNESSGQQQLVTEYLNSAGYEVSAVPDQNTLRAALKAGEPYAVVAHTETAPDPEDENLRGCRTAIPSRIPFVIFSLNDQEMPEFRLFNGELALEPSTRLNDAIRGSKRSSGKELKTVLIIDDEPALLELLGLTLVKRGFQVLREADGMAGLESARKHHPDIIILDLAMPKVGGKQLIEELRSDSKTKNIPILIHTGTVLDEAQRHSLAEHVHAITFKCEQQALFAELERLETLTDGPLELEATL
ncbi:MAG TPA: MASE1 domain-containing protein [Verrucomicrobiae bacterium]|nr:MASE1 domain-containing protein [Verrucomicrobiae bacterium]